MHVILAIMLFTAGVFANILSRGSDILLFILVEFTIVAVVITLVLAAGLSTCVHYAIGIPCWIGTCQVALTVSNDATDTIGVCTRVCPA
jgi:hypothetical protein